MHSQIKVYFAESMILPDVRPDRFQRLSRPVGQGLTLHMYSHSEPHFPSSMIKLGDLYDVYTNTTAQSQVIWRVIDSDSSEMFFP